MRDDKNEYTQFVVDTDDISGLFYMNVTSNVLSFADAKHFIKDCISKDMKSKITNMNSMFYGNYGMKYGLEEFKSDLLGNSTNYISFSEFTKVSDVRYMFTATNVRCFNKNMLNFGSSSITIDGFISPNANLDDEDKNLVYVTIDSLENIISKVTELFGTYNNSRRQFTFLDENGNIIDKNTEIKLKEFFNPNGKAPVKLQSLTRFYLNINQTFDFTDTFTSEWGSLTQILDVIWQSNARYKGIDNLLYDLPKLNYIGLLFSHSDIAERTDLMQFINWEKFINNGGYIHYSDEHDIIFDFDKLITLDNYLALCNLFIKSTTLTNLPCIFKNCNIIGNTDDFTFGNITTENNSIKFISYLFDNCKLVQNEKEIPIPISQTFFHNLNAITDVYMAFSNCSFKKPIPFNFFNKRQVSQSESGRVYTGITEDKKEDMQPNATLTIYEYRSEITDFYGVFFNSKFSEGSRHFELDKNTPENTVVSDDGEKYTEYYTKKISYDEEGNAIYRYKKHTLQQSTEITDCKNLKGYFQQNIEIYDNGNYENPKLDQNQQNVLCIPPDFFYGINTTMTVNCSSAFACNSDGCLTGMIPEHIFSKNRNVRLQNTFSNQIIVPRFIDSYINDGNTVNIYSLFPSNYTTYSDLKYAFNVYPIIPVNTQNETNYVFVILKDSIPKSVNRLDYAFQIQTTPRNYIRSQKAGKLNSYISYIGEYQNGSVTLGFDMQYFNNLYIDNLFNGSLGFFNYGRLFNDGFILSEKKITNTGNIVFRPAYSLTEGDSEISVNIKFPQADNSIKYFYNRYTTNNNVKTEQIMENSRAWYSEAGFDIK